MGLDIVRALKVNSMELDAETKRSIDEFLLMLARCKTQEERRQLVYTLAEKMVRITEQHQQRAQVK
jgi:hypothetical protein